jgi:hypothetical protein
LPSERARDCDQSQLVPPEWAWVRLLASTCATGVGLSTRAMNFRPKVRLPPERA